jgi:hypothetical protein
VRLMLAAVVVAALAGTADAYPQLQLSTGTDTCRQCHFSPGGGGLINDYGRDEATSLAHFEIGDGRFLHGAWSPPASFQIGYDLRLAGGARVDPVDVAGSGDSLLGPTRTEGLLFPMQGDLYLRPKVGAFSLYLAVGPRAAAREGRSAVERLGSREHYLMYEPGDGAWYARAGRFYPVYGIRTQDHTAYVRRHLQMYLLEEPYGVAYGRYEERSELHVSAFTGSPSPYLGVAVDTGVAAYWEQRNEEATAAYAAQTKLTISDTDRRGWLGGVYKRWMEAAKLLVLAEVDVGLQAFPAPDAGSTAADPDPRLQLVGYLGATYMARKGLMVGGAVQLYDPDLGLASTSREAFEANVQWFPIPHLELHLLTRLELVGIDPGDAQLLTLVQLHYFL